MMKLKLTALLRIWQSFATLTLRLLLLNLLLLQVRLMVLHLLHLPARVQMLICHLLLIPLLSALAPVTAVEFLQHDELKGAADLTAARNTLADKFAKENASAAVAAKNGCVDGIIAKNEIRRTLMDSIEVMAGKEISRTA